LAQRLDKWLVYARFVKHRSLAASLIEQGQVRVNKERATKCSQTVKSEDVLTLAVAGHVKVIKVLGEADKRGSASKASALYQDLSCAEKADAQALSLC
jgi:ribosome-associated heat shock protein Hsp15